MSTPIGGIVYWPASAASIPSGFLACDGSAVSRTTYAALFAALGTIHGVGDGATTFNLPDLRDRMSPGAGGKYAVGNNGGSATWSPGLHTHGLNVTSTYYGNHGHGSWTFNTNDTTPPSGLAGNVNLTENAMAPDTHHHGTAVSITREATPGGGTFPHVHDLSGQMGATDPASVSQLPPYCAMFFIVKVS